tara:strand:- start:1345 stop:1638 length:294 start_codon:yes stop_codon:yes gene_type:complete
MHYMVDRLNRIVTESDLMGVIDELRGNIEVNQEWRAANPNDCLVDEYDVYNAVDNLKRDYVRRALSKAESVSEAAKLLGLSNYQTLQNWMDKLGVVK